MNEANAYSYTLPAQAMCTFGFCDSGVAPLISNWQQKSSPAYSLGHYEKCSSGCGKHSVGSSVMTIMPSAADVVTVSNGVSIPTNDFGIASIGLHEYIHVYQAWAAGAGMLPAWLLEGGAVQAECLLGKRVGVRASVTAVNERTSYRLCFQTGGGRSGILPSALYAIANAQRIYTSRGLGTVSNVLKQLGETICGCQKNPCSNHQDVLALQQKVQYDLGAVAVAYAIYKSKTRSDCQSSQCNSNDFWRGSFWPLIEKVDVNASTYSPNNLPENQGWKKAFLAFTGFANMDAFYNDFQTAITGKNAAQVLAWLETDETVDAFTTVNFAPAPSAPSAPAACSKTWNYNISGWLASPSAPPTPSPSSSSAAPCIMADANQCQPCFAYAHCGDNPNAAQCNQMPRECPAKFAPPSGACQYFGHCRSCGRASQKCKDCFTFNPCLKGADANCNNAGSCRDLIQGECAPYTHCPAQ